MSSPPPLDLRRRLQDAEEQIAVLEKERSLLEDVLAHETDQERAFSTELHAAKRQRDELTDELQQELLRSREIDAELCALEQQNELLRQELEESRRSCDRQSMAAQTVAKELDTYREQLGYARRTLSEVATNVARLSYRLEHESEGGRAGSLR